MLIDSWSEEWASHFLAYMTKEYGASVNTLQAYQIDLTQYREALGKPLHAATSDDIRIYIAGLLNAGISPRSCRRKLAAVRSFYRFAFGEAALSHNPAKTLRAPKAYKPVVRPITSKEVDQLLSSIGTERPLDLRNRALIYAVYGSGFRASEIIRLELRDLDFAHSVAKVRLGKGQKDRFVPLNDQEAAAIRLYLEDGRPKLMRHGDSEFVFIGRLREPFTRQRLWQILTRLSLPVLGRTVSPHSYRHAFITDSVNGGAEPRIVQTMVGHSSVLTTMGYMHSDLNRIRAEYLKCHPRGRKL